MSGDELLLAQYRSLYEHARDILLTIDADTGAILGANRAAERAYGYSRDELLAMTVFTLRVDTGQTVSSQMRTAEATGVLFEAHHRRRDGSTFPVEVSSRGEVVDGRRLLVSVIRDITDRKRLETERERLLATTQQALVARDEFLLVASHELRTPVANISLQLQHFQRLAERGASIEALRLDADGALREIQRLTRLIETLLDSQAAEGRVTLEVADLDLADLVLDVAARHRDQAAQAGCALDVEAPSIVGRWDRLRLDQVLTNLMGNALKYGAGHPVSVTAADLGERVRLEVRDRGIGLAREDASRIFRKFERAVAPEDYGGLGLGLYITRQLVEAHGGRIEIDSSLGAGATFRVTLPREPPKA